MIPLRNASGRKTKAAEKMWLNKLLIYVKAKKKQNKVGRMYQPKKTSVLEENFAL
jgi:hypothetical protein